MHGDTTTAFASALQAFYSNIPIGHVEAGLRTYNNRSPYPEEFNRQAIGSMATYHFAPTPTAVEHLLQEHKNPQRVYLTGDTVIDALKTTVQKDYEHPLLTWAAGSRLVLLTAHRRENLGEPMRNIFKAILKVLKEHEDVKVVYPIHLNPSVRKIADEVFDGFDRVKLIEPLDVIGFHNIMNKAYLIMAIWFCIAAGVLLLLVAFVIRECGRESGHRTDEEESVLVAEETQELLPRISYYPEALYLGQSLAEETLFRADGSTVKIGDIKGDYLILNFGGSWCKYCKTQLEQTNVYTKIAERYGNIPIVLVDKMDREKESVEQAQQYLQEQQISVTNLFDQDMTLYQKLGLKRIPTTIILDKEGKVLFCYTGVIENASQFEAMLSYAIQGYAAGTQEFVLQAMVNEQGGMYTEYPAEESGSRHPAGKDVLSESQGLLMQYALAADEKELFDRVYRFAKQQMQTEGLFAWYVAEGEIAGSNAFLDDLRIYGALLEADKKWGGYEQDALEVGNALLQKNCSKEGFVSFYDFSSKRMGNEISLCYIDLETITQLTQQGNCPEMLQNMQQILQDGYISDEFPFYYGSYSYESGRYSQESLNMAEAMYTLYHLSKTGDLKESSENWILEQLRNGGIMARYTVDGEIVKDYGYESTGIYALAVLIGLNCKNEEMVTKALSRMEEIRIFYSSSFYNGAFGNIDGTGIYSFDQCVSLLAYQALDGSYR